MSKYSQGVVHIEIKWYPKVDPFFQGVSNHACKKKIHIRHILCFQISFFSLIRINFSSKIYICKSCMILKIYHRQNKD